MSTFHGILLRHVRIVGSVQPKPTPLLNRMHAYLINHNRKEIVRHTFETPVKSKITFYKYPESSYCEVFASGMPVASFETHWKSKEHVEYSLHKKYAEEYLLKSYTLKYKLELE